MRILLLAAFLLIPASTHAALMFSEIAWMGTDASEAHEWIELFNHDFNVSGPGLDVTGWTLTDGNDLNLTLSGTIRPMTIVVLERDTDASVPGVSAFQTFTGELANSGETLTLKNAAGATVAEVAGGANWSSIGGRSSTPKKTPQQAMTGWVTGAPTPGAENVAHDDPNLDANTDDDGGSDTNDNNKDNDDTDGGGSVKGENTTRTSSGGGSGRRQFVKSTAVLTLDVVGPDTVYVNAPVSMSAVPSDVGPTITSSLTYTWNFGDAYTGEGKTVTHTYTQPGEYVVVLRGAYARHDTAVEHVITVLPVTVVLGRTGDGDITLKNPTTHTVDLSGYTLRGTKSIVFPPHSRILAGKTLTIDRERVDGGTQAAVALYDTTPAIVAREGVSARIAEAVVPAPSRARAPVASVSTGKPALQAPAPARAPAEELEVLPPIPSAIPGVDAPILKTLTESSIPVYAAAAAGSVPEGESRNVLPYAALLGLGVIAVVVLLTRQGHGASVATSSRVR